MDEMSFHSILCREPDAHPDEDGVPEHFHDLNLDQVVERGQS